MPAQQSAAVGSETQGWEGTAGAWGHGAGTRALPGAEGVQRLPLLPLNQRQNAGDGPTAQSPRHAARRRRRRTRPVTHVVPPGPLPAQPHGRSTRRRPPRAHPVCPAPPLTSVPPRTTRTRAMGRLVATGRLAIAPSPPSPCSPAPCRTTPPAPGVYAPKNEGDGGNRPIIPVVRRWVAHPARPRPGDHPYAAATVVSAPRCSNAVAQPPKRRCCTCNISASPESDALAIPIARHSPSSPPFHDLPRPTARPGYADKACTPTAAPYAPPPTAVVSAPENTDDDVACRLCPKNTGDGVIGIRPAVWARTPAPTPGVCAPENTGDGAIGTSPPLGHPPSSPPPRRPSTRHRRLHPSLLESGSTTVQELLLESILDGCALRDITNKHRGDMCTKEEKDPSK
ncbi:hypothetical protein B0H17DRAFT_1140263 [Mycena rosella]|uniref:Uncharacterized protein n=1 Tax=Mycena rosella TaxID=1033263 RepID=A0AAD7D2C2_MYCRO|nr:hypothetical protein B0H17DRAFT_1140263 [Mycena rosella]